MKVLSNQYFLPYQVISQSFNQLRYFIFLKVTFPLVNLLVNIKKENQRLVEKILDQQKCKSKEEIKKDFQVYEKFKKSLRKIKGRKSSLKLKAIRWMFDDNRFNYEIEIILTYILLLKCLISYYSVWSIILNSSKVKIDEILRQWKLKQNELQVLSYF